MPRRKRIDTPGAWHHVMNRGADQANIFFEDEDCEKFLEEVADAVASFGVEVHAFSLTPNHFHLLVRSPNANLSAFMKQISGKFTQRRNRRTGGKGPVFRGRYRSQLLTDNQYLRHLVGYIHLNPVRAGLVKRPDEDCWTSHRYHTGLQRAPAWLSTDMVRKQLGKPAQVQDFVANLHRKKQPWPDEMDLGTGWLSLPTDPRPGGVRAREPGAKLMAADDVLAKVQRVTGATADDLRQLARGRGANPARRFAMWMLARHTTLTHAQIGERVGGSAGSVAQLRHRLRGAVPPALAAWEKAWGSDDG